MKLEWSPADLGRQRGIVRSIATRAELDRARLHAARRASVDALRRALGTPAGLGGCFLAGVAIGAVSDRHVPTSAGQRNGNRLGTWLATLLWLGRRHVELKRLERRNSTAPGDVSAAPLDVAASAGGDVRHAAAPPLY